MKNFSLLLLSLFLCSMSMPLLAQDANLVPAMVVQMENGTEQIIELDYTSVTDFSALVSKGTLAVSVPERDVTGVRSITFAMVKKANEENKEEDEDITSLEEVSSLSNATTDKVLLNGKLFIRITMPDGNQVWYDVMGNIVINYE